MRQFLLAFLLFAVAADASTDQDLRNVAIENKNAEFLINEFTYNWTLKVQDAVENARQMMTTLTKKESYTVQRETTGFDAGLTKKIVLGVMNALPISPEFRRKIQQSLTDENCEYLVDDEMKFDKVQKILSYARIGYTKMRPDVDKYLLIRSLLVVRYPDLPKDTEKFLECAAKYEVDEKRCPISQNLSIMDWISYKIWTRAKTITNFMVEHEQRFQAVERHLQQLKQYLPADYQKPRKCDVERPDEGCETIINPKLGNLTHMAQTANASDITKNELKKIQALLKTDVTERAAPGLFCQSMDKNQLDKMLDHLIAEELLNQESVEQIRQQISSKDALVIDVLFNKKDDKKQIYFSRIFILGQRDSSGDEFVMGGVFIQLTIKNEIRAVEQQQTCDQDSAYCFTTSIEFPTNDALLKKYVAKKAVDSLINQQQPEKSEQKPWWQGTMDGDHQSDEGSSEERNSQDGQNRKRACPQNNFRSLYEAQSHGLSRAMIVQDVVKDQKKAAYPDLLDESSKVIPLPTPMMTPPRRGLMLNEDKDMEALKKMGYQFWIQRGFLDLYRRFMLNLTQAQTDEARQIAGKFKMASYSERSKAGVVLNLAVEKLKSVVDIWQSSKMIRPDEAQILKLTLDGQGEKQADKNFITERGQGEFIYTRVGFIKLLEEDNEKHGTMIYVLHTFHFNIPIEIKAVPTRKCYAWGLFCETKIDMVPQDPRAITLSEQEALANYMLLKTAEDYDRENGPYIKYLIRESDRYAVFLPANMTAPIRKVEDNPGKDPEEVVPENPIDADHFTV